MRELTDKQARFVEEYVICLNATKAAELAGYSAKTADKQGTQLLAIPSVSAAIQAKQEKLSKKSELKAERVLNEIARIAFSDLRKAFDERGGLKPIQELDDDTAAAVASIEVVEERNREGEIIGFTKKLKLWDKNKAIDNACKHLGLTKDKLELTGKDGGPIKTEEVQLSDEERLERLNKLILAVKARHAIEGAKS
ncbi:MAG TPA: terminase small subunit [Gemmatales bacterium]|nr:terminase small subunit [Gemmatales bacterium]